MGSRLKQVTLVVAVAPTVVVSVLPAVGAVAAPGVPVISTFAGGGLEAAALTVGQEPAAVAVLDRPGGPLVYVADQPNSVVRLLDVAAGTERVVAGKGVYGSGGEGGPATSAKLRGPNAVAVDRAGNLFILDIDAYTDSYSRVFKVGATDGVITAVASAGTSGSGGDNGPATAAQFDDPRGVAVGPTGDLFIADTRNLRVRRVDAATGVITTVAGTGAPGFSGEGGPATSARIFPDDVAVDASGNLGHPSGASTVTCPSRSTSTGTARPTSRCSGRRTRRGTPRGRVGGDPVGSER